MPRLPLLILFALLPAFARAHPVVQHALDLTIHPDRLILDARLSMEEVLLIENGGQPGAQAAPAAPPEKWPVLVTAHANYALRHLHVWADNAPLTGRLIRAAAPAPDSDSRLATYQFEYAFPTPKPEEVRLGQTFLLDYQWQAACTVRVRQAGRGDWDAASIAGPEKVVYGCTWDATTAATAPTTAAPPSPDTIGRAPTHLPYWPTARTYFRLGLLHILGWEGGGNGGAPTASPEPLDAGKQDGGWSFGRPAGLDHILFVCALVLVVRSFWDLIKVVTAFTLAHTVTLTLSVLGWLRWLHLSDHLIESMIAASIVAVALQNVLWPKSTRGAARLAIAFAFGLFHGLGFAGGLREAMSEMPGAAMATALTSFSLGVEAGHQIVVIPLFLLLMLARQWGAPAPGKPNPWVARWAVPVGSVMIAVAGAWFLVEALRG